MTLAEKYYRKFYKVKDDVKLTNEQWKVVNMMHACLREYNTVKLPVGVIMVNKKNLSEHLNHVQRCLNETDKVMLKPEYKEFSNGKGGSEIAKIWNALNLTMQSIKHFELKIPLDRLNDEITE